MSASSRLTLLLLWALLLASAITVVWSRHQARSLFIQMQALTSERDALDIEWGQLKLEQGAWATHGRVEQTARVDLRMVIPRPDEVHIVAPEAANPPSDTTNGNPPPGFPSVVPRDSPLVTVGGGRLPRARERDARKSNAAEAAALVVRD